MKSHLTSTCSVLPQFGPSTRLKNLEQHDLLTMLELLCSLCKWFLLPAFDITVLGSTIHSKRLRFFLKWVLNSIELLIWIWFWLFVYADLIFSCSVRRTWSSNSPWWLFCTAAHSDYKISAARWLYEKLIFHFLHILSQSFLSLDTWQSTSL